MKAFSFTDLKKYFKKDDFSDITIKVRDREIKLHKIMLCCASTYFQLMLKPDGPFAESKQRDVELKEDDPAAVECMIAWMYGINAFQHRDWSTETTKFATLELYAQYLLDVYSVAEKYLLPQLSDDALMRLNDILNEHELWSSTSWPDLTADQIFELVKLFQERVACHEALGGCMILYVKHHTTELMQNKDFRSWLVKDGDSVRKVFETLLEQGARCA